MKAIKGIISKRRLKIAKRDKWVCQLCFEKIETLVNLSSDHIIPVSKGGTNALKNQRAAHTECNLIKGDSLVDLTPSEYRKKRRELQIAHELNKQQKKKKK